MGSLKQTLSLLSPLARSLGLLSILYLAAGHSLKRSVSTAATGAKLAWPPRAHRHLLRLSFPKKESRIVTGAISLFLPTAELPFSTRQINLGGAIFSTRSPLSGSVETFEASTAMCIEVRWTTFRVKARMDGAPSPVFSAMITFTPSNSKLPRCISA